MLQQVFRTLEAFGQFFTDCLLDHAGTGKTDQRVRLRDVNIAQHGVAGRDAPRGGVGEHNDIRQVRFLEHLHSDRGARHLHQAQDALLHTRATGGGKQDQRALQLYRFFCRGDDSVADIHPHGPRHKAEVLRASYNRRAPDITGHYQHRLRLFRLLLRGAQTFGIFLLIAELQRVNGGRGHFHFGEDTAIKQRRKAVTRADVHVVAAIGAHVQIVADLAVKQHRAAFVALRPKILGCLAARKDRVDPGSDVVVDPVHIDAS